MTGQFMKLGANLVAGVFIATAACGSVASAQVLNPQRDCHTLLKCNYAKGGSFRGCISTYSCKSCRLVPVSCSAPGASSCRKIKCSWDL